MNLVITEFEKGRGRGERRGTRVPPKIHLSNTSQMHSVLVLCAAVSNRRNAELEEAIPCVSSLQSLCFGVSGLYQMGCL